MFGLDPHTWFCPGIHPIHLPTHESHRFLRMLSLSASKKRLPLHVVPESLGYSVLKEPYAPPVCLPGRQQFGKDLCRRELRQEPRGCGEEMQAAVGTVPGDRGVQRASEVQMSKKHKKIRDSFLNTV